MNFSVRQGILVQNKFLSYFLGDSKNVSHLVLLILVINLALYLFYYIIRKTKCYLFNCHGKFFIPHLYHLTFISCKSVSKSFFFQGNVIVNQNTFNIMLISNIVPFLVILSEFLVELFLPLQP